MECDVIVTYNEYKMSLLLEFFVTASTFSGGLLGRGDFFIDIRTAEPKVLQLSKSFVT